MEVRELASYSLLQSLSLKELKLTSRTDRALPLYLDEVELDDLNLIPVPNLESLSKEELVELLVERGGWSEE